MLSATESTPGLSSMKRASGLGLGFVAIEPHAGHEQPCIVSERHLVLCEQGRLPRARDRKVPDGELQAASQRLDSPLLTDMRDRRSKAALERSEQPLPPSVIPSILVPGPIGMMFDQLPLRRMRMVNFSDWSS